jgi:hypothetical protein
MNVAEGLALALALFGFLAAAAFEESFKPRRVLRLRRDAAAETLSTLPAE